MLEGTSCTRPQERTQQEQEQQRAQQEQERAQQEQQQHDRRGYMMEGYT